MEDCPLLDKAQGCLRPDAADHQLPVQVELGLLALMLSMEVGGRVRSCIDEMDSSSRSRGRSTSPMR
jgi:hypothetical protein